MLAPAWTVVALTVIEGGGLTVNVNAPEVPPPGAGVKTVTEAVPTVAMSPAPIDACSCVALTKVVGRADPFHRTIEEDLKLLPLTLSVNDGPPETALAGASELATGTGATFESTVTGGLVAARV